MKNYNILIVVGVVLLSVVFILFLAAGSKDNLTQNQRELVDLAVAAGADQEQFENDFASDAVKDAVEADLDEAANRGVTGTPAIFIAGTQQSDASYSGIKNILDTMLEDDTVEKPVQLEEFSDFNCPHCASFDLVLFRLETEYTDEEVIFVHKNYPFLRSSSTTYAEAYEAAKMQGDDVASAVRRALFTLTSNNDYSTLDIEE